MTSKVKPIPDGYHTATPYLSVRGAGAALDFYKRAFGAKEIMRMPGPNGTIGHAEIQIGNSRIMLADEFPQMGFVGPQTRGGTSVHLHLYVEDADARVAQAVAAGATVKRAVQDQFYGDRTGTIEDPFGHVWHLATHTEDVPEPELRRRAAEAMKQMGG